MKKIYIHTDFIRLDQALKLANLVGSGGESKIIIQEALVSVNGEIETRRGKKLRDGDVFEYEGESYRISG